MLRWVHLALLVAAAAGAHIRKGSGQKHLSPAGPVAATKDFVEPGWKSDYSRGSAAGPRHGARDTASGQRYSTGTTDGDRLAESNMLFACVLAALGSVLGLGLAAEMLQNMQKASLDKQLQGLGERAHLFLFPWLIALGWVYLTAVDRFMTVGFHKNFTCDSLVWYCLLTPIVTALSVSGQVLWLKGVSEQSVAQGQMGRMMGPNQSAWGIVSHIANDVQEEMEKANQQSKKFLAKRSVRLLLAAIQLGSTAVGAYLLAQPEANTCHLGIWWAAMALTVCTAAMLLVVVVTIFSVFLITRFLDDCVSVKQEWEFVIDALFVDQDAVVKEGQRSGLKLDQKAVPVQVVTTSGS